MPPPEIDWTCIHDVLLDMDGTLLDLHFDNHFWQVHVPKRYAEKNDLTIEQARQELFPRFRDAEGTLDWYCVDYWTEQLDLDIALLKEEVEHLIAVHPDVITFLKTMRRHEKRLSLVTNAHGKSLDIKMRRTRLEKYFDTIVCAHDLGLPKEITEFWGKLQTRIPFDPAKTLLVDDSLPVLRSARDYGIASLLTIHQPDSKSSTKEGLEFEAIFSFAEILP